MDWQGTSVSGGKVLKRAGPNVVCHTIEEEGGEIVVRIYTTFNIRNFAFSPQCVFLCFFGSETK